MRLTGHATVLLVADVHRSAAYYRDRLGFEFGAPARQEYGIYDFRVTDPDGYVLAFGRRG